MKSIEKILYGYFLSFLSLGLPTCYIFVFKVAIERQDMILLGMVSFIMPFVIMTSIMITLCIGSDLK